MQRYKFNPNKKEMTTNELAELMMYIISSIIRPNKPVTNNIILDQAFYEKLPEHIQEMFEIEEK